MQRISQQETCEEKGHLCGRVQFSLNKKTYRQQARSYRMRHVLQATCWQLLHATKSHAACRLVLDWLRHSWPRRKCSMRHVAKLLPRWNCSQGFRYSVKILNAQTPKIPCQLKCCRTAARHDPRGGGHHTPGPYLRCLITLHTTTTTTPARHVTQGAAADAVVVDFLK